MAASFNPLISVIIPNYNHGETLQRTVESVCSQTYQNWELLIADDASTDSSREKIEECVRKDSRIRATFAEKNRGLIDNLKVNMKLLSGEYYCGAGADDFISREDYFADAVEAFSQHPEAGIFGAPAQIVDAETLKETGVFGHAPREGFFEGREFLHLFLKGAINLHGASMIARFDYINKIGYDKELGPLADYAMYLSGCANLGIHFSSKKYITITVAERNYSKGSSVEQHVLFENKLKELIPYSSGMEEEFVYWRHLRILQSVADTVRNSCPHITESPDSLIIDAISCYPTLIVEQPKKKALLSLAARLREKAPAVFQTIVPDLVQLLDTAMRPFYETGSALIGPAGRDNS